MQVPLILFASIAAVAAIAPNSSAVTSNRTYYSEDHNQKPCPSSRIYYGRPYDPEEYPFVVCVMYLTSNSTWGVCTGSMISPLFVLTAAHCVDTDKRIVDNFRICAHRKIDPHDSRCHRVIHSYQSEIYDTSIPATKLNSHRGDIGLLELKTAFDDIDEYARIYGSPADFDYGKKKLKCVSIGFGETEKKSLSQEGLIIDITVAHGREICTQIDPTCKNFPKEFLDDFLYMIPAVSAPCGGDSGGPMICDGYLYGIDCFALSLDGVTLECGSLNAMEYFIFLHSYADWIYSVSKVRKYDPDSEPGLESESEDDSGTSILTPHRFFMILFVLVHQNLKH